MAKLTLNTLSTLSGTSAVNQLNSNSDLIESAVENTLSRDGTAPNYMEADLDMNSNRITNLTSATTSSEPATYAQLQAATVETDIPLQTGNSGKVMVTDGNVLSWSDLSGLNYDQGDSNAVERTLLSKLQEFVSVKDFGATGNGTTDDTTAIQNAIDSLGTDGGYLWFPIGTYAVEELSISQQSNITIGGRGTLTPYGSHSGYLLNIYGSTTAVRNNVWREIVNIDSLTVDGDRQSKGVSIAFIDHSCIKGLHIRNTSGVALNIEHVRETNFLVL